MSTKFFGNCENCGKNNLRITIRVHIHTTPGTLGSEEWCLECVNQDEKVSGREKKPQQKSTKWAAT
jgi:hypothetical protein